MRRDDSAGCTGVNQEDEAVEVISDVKKRAPGSGSVYSPPVAGPFPNCWPSQEQGAWQ